MPSARWLLAVTVALVALAEGHALQGGDHPAPAADTEAGRVIGYLPYWDQARALRTVENNSDLFTEISPFWYMLDSSGVIGLFENGWYEDESVTDSLRAEGIRIVPTLANLNDRGWDAEVVSQIINSPERMKSHIADIVGLVVANDYAGIDIDYESLYAHDRDAFSRFIQDLASALHEVGKTLSVVVYAKTSEPGPSNARAYDYVALAQAADQVRVMVYNYHWTGSSPGPIAPLCWAQRVARFAASAVPKEKLVLAFGLYGIDWIDSSGEEITWREVVALIDTYNAEERWDSKSYAPWFSYTDSSGNARVVWFENAGSIAHKLDVASEYGVTGIAFWHLGGEQQRVWQVVSSRFLGASSTTGLAGF